jgi:hypothetical protein
MRGRKSSKMFGFQGSFCHDFGGRPTMIQFPFPCLGVRLAGLGATI